MSVTVLANLHFVRHFAVSLHTIGHLYARLAERDELKGEEPINTDDRRPTPQNEI